LSVNGAVSGGSFSTSGAISATGSITGGSFSTSGAVTANGNISTSGAISATSDITTNASLRSQLGGGASGQVVLGNGSYRLYQNGGSFDLNGNLTVGGNIVSNQQVKGTSLLVDTNQPYYMRADGAVYMLWNGDAVYFNQKIQTPGIIRTTGQSIEIGTGQGESKNLSFHNSARVMTLYLDTSGTFGLADNSAGFSRWYSPTNGDFNVYGTLYQGVSDARLKKNIAPISDALAKVNRISGVTFNLNELAGSFGHKDTRTQVGVLAHEIEATLPEAVALAPFDANHDGETVTSKSGENYKTVQYEKIVPLLIEAIKELSAKVDALEKRVAG
jgi:hypothetical protein